MEKKMIEDSLLGNSLKAMMGRSRTKTCVFEELESKDVKVEMKKKVVYVQPSTKVAFSRQTIPADSFVAELVNRQKRKCGSPMTSLQFTPV